jgi:hypothetical protein
MVKLIVVNMGELKTLVTMVTSKRSSHRDIGNLGNEAHPDNPEIIVTITFKIRSLCKRCAVFVRF